MMIFPPTCFFFFPPNILVHTSGFLQLKFICGALNHSWSAERWHNTCSLRNMKITQYKAAFQTNNSIQFYFYRNDNKCHLKALQTTKHSVIPKLQFIWVYLIIIPILFQLSDLNSETLMTQLICLTFFWLTVSKWLHILSILASVSLMFWFHTTQLWFGYCFQTKRQS